jgi:hypothetical protein
MSTTATRVPLSQAEALACELAELLGPACERLEIAGSIRRQRPTIGDLELVLIPKYEQRSTDLFGQQFETVNLLDERCNALLAGGLLSQRQDKNGRPRWGSGLKLATFRGVNADLFPVVGPTSQFGVIFLIRTGSADFSHRFVTPVHQGGWMPETMRCQKGALWKGYQMLLRRPKRQTLSEPLASAGCRPSSGRSEMSAQPEELTRALGQLRAARTELLRLERRRPDQLTESKLLEIKAIRQSLGVEMDSLEMVGLLFEHEAGIER